MLCLVLSTLGAAVLSIPLHAATPDEEAVLAPINAMFDGMTKRDAAAIKGVSGA